MSTCTVVEAGCFSITTGKLIPMADAEKLIERYKTATEENQDAVHSFFFGRNQIKNLLDQAGTIGVRIHLGMDEEGIQKLVVFPADQYGTNIPVKNSFGQDFGLDAAVPCPPFCPPPLPIKTPQ